MTVVRSPAEGVAAKFLRNRIEVSSAAAAAVALVSLLALLLQRHLLGLHREVRLAQRSRGTLQRVFDASATASLLVRSDGAIVKANRQAEEVFGWGNDQLRQMHVCDLAPEAGREASRARLAAFFDAPVEHRMGIGWASDGQRALGRGRACQRPPDSDRRRDAADRNRWRALRAVGSDRARIPILGLTAEAIREELDKCLAAGMDDTVTKPFDGEQLLAKVAALGRQRRVVP